MLTAVGMPDDEFGLLREEHVAASIRESLLDAGLVLREEGRDIQGLWQLWGNDLVVFKIYIERKVWPTFL